MTDNLPVPAVPRFATGTPLSMTPTPALTFALGYVVTQRVDVNHLAPFVGLCDELRRRGEWDTLLGTLPTEVGQAVSMLYQMHRGQQWARTGRMPG